MEQTLRRLLSTLPRTLMVRLEFDWLILVEVVHVCTRNVHRHIVNCILSLSNMNLNHRSSLVFVLERFEREYTIRADSIFLQRERGNESNDVSRDRVRSR